MVGGLLQVLLRAQKKWWLNASSQVSKPSSLATASASGLWLMCHFLR